VNWFVSPAEMAEHRADAESRMGAANNGSDAIVHRQVTRLDQNELDGSEDPGWVVVHEGPMRLAGARQGASGVRRQQAPGGDHALGDLEAHWPASVPRERFREGDLIEIAAGESADTFWSVKGIPIADQQTARRLPVEAAQRPSDWGL
jgi:Family of unknown function (DUF6093)